MQKTKLFKPYLQDKTNRRAKCKLKITGAGVYYIYERITGTQSFKLVYIGYASSDVKRTMYRHFQKWIDKRHPETRKTERIERVSYFDKYFKNDDYKCKVVFCKDAQESANLELAQIAKLKPRDNRLKMQFDEMVKYNDLLEKAQLLSEKQAFDDLPF